MFQILARCITATAIAASTVALPAFADITFTKIPATYITDGKAFNNVEGYIVDIKNYRDLKYRVPPDIEDLQVKCDTIDGPEWQQARNQCFGGKVFTCASLYQYAPGKFSKFSPDTGDKYNRLVPIKPASAYVDTYKRHRVPNKEIFAINLGFFNTDPFPNRPTDETQWRGIYNEPCAYNFGSLKPYQNNEWLSEHDDQKPYNGQTDRAFDTLIIEKSNNSIDFIASQWDSDIDRDADYNDTVLNGVFLRFDTRRIGVQDLPEFVQDKKDSKVGRTAIGWNAYTKETRILVIQPGKGNPDLKGADIGDVRKFFPPQKFGHVMLLDGAGSAQLASTRVSRNIGPQFEPRRDCQGYSKVKECSLRGDSAPKNLVDHYSSASFAPDPNNPNNYLVDRRVPNVLVFWE